jgi:hypothetical protein
MKLFVSNCPANIVEGVAGHILSPFMNFLLSKLQQEWDTLAKRGVIEDDDDE